MWVVRDVAPASSYAAPPEPVQVKRRSPIPTIILVILFFFVGRLSTAFVSFDHWGIMPVNIGSWTKTGDSAAETVIWDNISEIEWSDQNLENAVREILNKKEGAIRYMHVKGITSLSLSNKGISDISSLRYFTGLKELKLADNNISDLSALSELNGLTSLILGNNNIKDLTPLAGLTNLEVLSLYGNKITDVTPLANLTKLERLWLSDNQITDISALDNLTNLRMLKINGNPVNE